MVFLIHTKSFSKGFFSFAFTLLYKREMNKKAKKERERIKFKKYKMEKIHQKENQEEAERNNDQNFFPTIILVPFLLQTSH